MTAFSPKKTAQTRPSKVTRKAPAQTLQRGSSNPAPKVEADISADSIQMALRMRYNPIRGLTMQRLVFELDNFSLGYLAYAALTWDFMEKRHHMLKGVSAKRRKDVSRLKLEITKKDNSSEADLHAEALREFYDNLSCINAIDQNERGGVSMLIRTMMDSIGKYYSVHEIVWQPGEVLTAEFRWVPLWFFENRTGRLRYLEVPLGGAQGEEMEEGGWMVTRGDGLMETCSILYALSAMPLKDWLAYSDKFGTPGVLGKTNAAKGSPAGDAMAAAVTAFGANLAAVVYGADDSVKDPISLIEAARAGDLPFEPLIERCERAMASLWRGNDLSTMSADNKGASVQDGESEILLVDDATLISETLQQQVDKWVIWQKFGTDRPLAQATLVVPERSDLEKDLKVDTFLLSSGARIGMRERLAYYGRQEMAEDDEALHSPVAATERITDSVGPDGKPVLPPTDKTDPLGNAQLLANATKAAGKVADHLGVPAGWISPIEKLLADLQKKTEDPGVSDDELLAFFEEVQKRIPELFGEMDVTELAKVFESALGAAVLEGVRSEIAQTKKTAKKSEK